jgi:hypothetical protein
MTVYHMHHIIPRHAGGSDNKNNLVKLSVEEHAEAHRQLYLEYGRWQDKVAWLSLSGRINSEEIRIMLASEANKGPRSGRRLKATLENAKRGNDVWRGQSHSEETKKTISEKNKEYWGNLKVRPWQEISSFTIEGKSYNGFKQICEEYGISRQTVYNRVNSEKFPGWVRNDK